MQNNSGNNSELKIGDCELYNYLIGWNYLFDKNSFNVKEDIKLKMSDLVESFLLYLEHPLKVNDFGGYCWILENLNAYLTRYL